MSLLKIAALDETDLGIVSAHVQDGVVKTGDIEYEPARQRFALALNRFAWEEKPRWWQRRYERRRAALSFDRVTKVSTSGIDRSKPDEILSLLALQATALPGGDVAIDLVFSENRTIRLEAECIEARLGDLGPSWDTGSKPRHEA